MNLKFLKITALFFAALAAQNFLSAQNSAQAQGSTQNTPKDANIKLDIRFYDKKIYYVEEAPIFIEITISNSSPVLYNFKLADDRAFSIDFNTRTRTNREIEAAPALERKRSGAGRVFFRNITIESGESFSFVEDLRNYSKIDKPGDYIVELSLYPELYNPPDKITLANYKDASSGAAPLVSNRLPLHIKGQPLLGADGVPVALDVDSDAIYVREKLAPDEVVSYTITARQHSQWEKYFLYLDLEKMISRDGARERRWRNESEEGRERMLASYREELQKSKIDGDISSIPAEFKIENTNYNEEEGKVVVLEKFKTDAGYTEVKRYTYYLEREDPYWMIVDYVVTNLGTE